MPQPVLSVQGDRIAGPDGHLVALRGYNIGGWMNMENFLTGYPGTESQHRRILRQVLGPHLRAEGVGVRAAGAGGAALRAARLYAILDFHALPGAQNQHWHSDNGTHRAGFWIYRHFQDRAVHLWEAIAGRFRGNPAVAG